MHPLRFGLSVARCKSNAFQPRPQSLTAGANLETERGAREEEAEVEAEAEAAEAEAERFRVAWQTAIARVRNEVASIEDFRPFDNNNQGLRWLAQRIRPETDNFSVEFYMSLIQQEIARLKILSEKRIKEWFDYFSSQKSNGREITVEERKRYSNHMKTHKSRFGTELPPEIYFRVLEVMSLIDPTHPWVLEQNQLNQNLEPQSEPQPEPQPEPRPRCPPEGCAVMSYSGLRF